MKKMRFVASLLAIQSVAVTAIADISTERQNELLYLVRQDCGSCHGLTLKGGLGPALLPETLAAKPKKYLVTTILEGRKDTAMPPWKTMLSFDDASWIAEQLQQGLIAPSQIARTKKTVDLQ